MKASATLAWLGVLLCLFVLPGDGAHGPGAGTGHAEAAEAKPAEAQPAVVKPAPAKAVPDAENWCILCHANLTEKDQARFLVTPENFAHDIHWQKGLRCHDCHGGDPSKGESANKAHHAADNFRPAPKTPEEARKFCVSCHKQEGLDLLAGVHDKAGPKDKSGAATLMTCGACHGPSAHRMPSPTKSPLEARKICAACHKPQEEEMFKGVHNEAGPKDAAGVRVAMTCGACHGTSSHRILRAADAKSPVFLDRQVQTCGGCHEEYLKSYRESVHGQALYKQGLKGAPVCATCHGAHGVYRAVEDRSTLHPTNVAATCGQCHLFIQERLEASVHGHGAGGKAERAAPGGIIKQKPSCTSCHQGHDIPETESASFRLQLHNRCGNCHAKLSSRYALSIHGELTALGYSPAAKCSDCHGAHDILPLADPASHLSPARRGETCGKCHPGASGNFLAFNPHTDHTDAERDPLVHGVYVLFLTLLFTTFGFFGLHSIFWFARGLVDVLQHGRQVGLRPGAVAYVRFTSFHRIGHTILLVSFLGLALTGLPLKYGYMPWAQALADGLGGFESTSFWHRFFAIITFACFLTYIARLTRLYFEGRSQGLSRIELWFGANSPIPNLRDVSDFGKMVKWFVGLGPKPSFDRWTYWEKFDFWGAIADIIIIGFTGLVLWFPNFFCRFLPATAVNIAQVIHSTQALLATGFVFAIHFFNTHFRPEKFPADMSVLTGLISEEEFREERPQLYERLEREGELEKIRTVAPSRIKLWAIKLGGFAALAVGLALLAGMVVAALGG